jgi:hypothetical protein
MATGYEEISAAFAVSRQADERWANEIRSRAISLQTAVRERYGSPQGQWHHPNGTAGGYYVHLFALGKGPRTFSTPLPDECFAPGYKLKFGLAVTVDAGAQSFPKRIFWQAVAAQFQGGVCKFRSLDENGDETAEREWFDSVDAYAEYFLGKLVAHLSFDPFQGPKPSFSMGFVPVESR